LNEGGTAVKFLAGVAIFLLCFAVADVAQAQKFDANISQITAVLQKHDDSNLTGSAGN